MGYVIVFGIGFILGIVVISCLLIGSRSEKIEEAYNKGFEEGKRVSSNESGNYR